MSILPIETISSYRKNLDMIIEIYGVPCQIFIPKNTEAREKLDIYSEAPALKFEDPVETKIWIEWNPTMKRLRNLGVFTDDENLPIIAFIRSDHMIKRNSYFSLNMNFDVGADQAEEFEFVDRLVRKAYDATVVEAWKIAPRRT